MPEAALLIVDVQRGFVNRHTEHIPALVEPLQHQYAAVFATRFHNPPNSSFRRLIGFHRFDEGSDEHALAFIPASHALIIDKPAYGCITESFLAVLEASGTSEVHLCGIDTDICVTKCAVDLFEAGLVPKILSRCCASHAGPHAHQRGLATLRRFIGTAQVI